MSQDPRARAPDYQCGHGNLLYTCPVEHCQARGYYERYQAILKRLQKIRGVVNFDVEPEELSLP
jgi:hypothetical protein